MKDYAFDILDALQAPILTHAATWADSIPERLIKTIPMARMLHLMQKKEYATLEEATAFLITRTYEAPMTSEWADIYVHCACITCERNFNEDHFEKVHASRKLTDYQERYLLNPLLKWIYEKRRKHLKSRISAEEKAEALVVDINPAEVKPKRQKKAAHKKAEAPRLFIEVEEKNLLEEISIAARNSLDLNEKAKLHEQYLQLKQ